MRVKRNIKNPKHFYPTQCQTGKVISDGHDGFYMVKWDDGGKSCIAKDMVKVVDE